MASSFARLKALLSFLSLCCFCNALEVSETALQVPISTIDQVITFSHGVVQNCSLHFAYIEYSSERVIENHLTLLKLSIESVAFVHPNACVDIVTDDAQLVEPLQQLNTKIGFAIHLVPSAICLDTHDEKWMARLQCLEAQCLKRFMYTDILIIDADVIIRSDLSSVFAHHDFDVAVTVTHQGRTFYSMHVNVGVKFFKNVSQHVVNLWLDFAQEYLAVRARPTPSLLWLLLFFGTGAENQRILESWTHLVEPYTAKYHKGVQFFALPCTIFNYARWWLDKDCVALAWSSANAKVKTFHFNGRSDLKQQPLQCYTSLVASTDGIGLQWDSQLLLITAESRRLVYFTIANDGVVALLDRSLHSLKRLGVHKIFVASSSTTILKHCKEQWEINSLALPPKALCLELGVFQLLARLSLDVLYFKPGALFHRKLTHQFQESDLQMLQEHPLDLFYMSGQPSTHAFMAQLRARCAAGAGHLSSSAMQQALHQAHLRFNMSSRIAPRSTFCVPGPDASECHKKHPFVTLKAPVM